MNLEDFEFGEVKGAMTLVHYLGNEKKVVIPDEFEGKPVTVIGRAAFGQGRKVLDVEELELPKHLEIIFQGGCSYLKKLKKVILPDSLKEIHGFGFSGCICLDEIVLPSSLTSVRADAFAKCYSLKKVVAVSESTKVTPRAFGDGEFLEKISFSLLKCLDVPIQARLLTEKILNFATVPEEEQEEMKSHLKKKVNLRKELLLSENVQIISFLLELKVKLTLELLDECLEASVQGEKTEVTAVFLDYKNKNFAKNVQEDYNTNKELVEIGLELPTLKQFKAKWKCSTVEGGLSVSAYKGSETHETIPAQLADGTKIVALRVRNAGKPFCIELKSITHLTIEAPLTAIEDKAFMCRRNLVSLILPDTIETVGAFAFDGCRNLESLELPLKIRTIGEFAFENCTSLEEITIPESVEVLEKHTFNNCMNLKKVNFLGNIPEMKVSMFKFCHSLADKDGFVVVEHTIFDYIGNSEKIILPSGVKVISSYAFLKKDFQEVVIPDSVEFIGKYAFADNLSLHEVTLPRGVKLGEKAFDAKVTINWK